MKIVIVRWIDCFHPQNCRVGDNGICETDIDGAGLWIWCWKGEWDKWCWIVLDCVVEVVDCVDDAVFVSWDWHFEVVGWKELDGVGITCGFGFPDPDAVAAVVVHCWADVPCVFAVGIP